MAHFIDLSDIESEQLRNILESAKHIKTLLKAGEPYKPLNDAQLAMIFEKPSTRTRASFEVGINQLGGKAIIIHAEHSQLGRGEPISDTAQVLSRYVDLVMIRCYEHKTLVELSKHSTAPVINGLTDYSHPCQVMADLLTFEEHRGSIQGKKVAWIGDGNNMTTSWIHAAAKLGFSLAIAAPEELAPDDAVINWAKDAGADVTVTHTPSEAVANADLVTTDTWVSMGDEDAQQRQAWLAPYQVDAALMKHADSDALFMHCLPAHRGEEVTEDVIDGPQSVIFDEAENRLHIQKAIMIWCLKN